MKTKFLSALICAVMLVGFTACEEEEVKNPNNDGTEQTPNDGTQPTDSVDVNIPENAVMLKKVVSAFLVVDNTPGGVSEYYLVLSEDENTTYNSSSNQYSAKNTRLLFLDLYSQETATTILASGAYTGVSIDAVQSGTFATDYTYYVQYDSKGKMKTVTKNNLISEAVQVERLDNNNNYRIVATANDGTVFAYEGRINFIDSNAGNQVYPQIREDLNITATGGMAIYNGDIYNYGTGEMMISLFDCDFDEASGYMKEKGHMICLYLYNKKFAANPKIEAGSYTVARNFGKWTYFPGMEIDYMGVTVVQGCYVKRRKAMNGDDGDYAFTYLTGGTIDIIENADGTFDFNINMTTADGYEVKSTAKNIDFTVQDLSEDEVALVSNLTEDVELDLSEIDTARMWNYGTHNYPSATVVNGCRSFTLDIGSPALGRDFVDVVEGDSVVAKQRLDGDIFRIEFLVEDGYGKPLEGVYTVMEENHHWTNLYEPFKLVQGCLKDVDFIGTRYQHFKEGNTLVMDLLAPVVEGTVSIYKADENGNYRIVINVIEEAGFNITGEWTGYIKYMYNVDAITDETKVNSTVVRNNNAKRYDRNEAFGERSQTRLSASDLEISMPKSNLIRISK